MTPVAIGDVLAGKYRVTKVLGVGGMGVVVAATHIQLDEPVALKFMLPEALGSPESVSRFLREARAAVKLRSEHVARVSDVGTLETGAPYIVMEYLDGTDLAGLLATQGTLPPEEAVEYILQACDALAEAHSLGIVHRDLKPANLYLTRRRDGTPLVKVLDFGISKSSALSDQGVGSLTKTGGIMGSPLYMSPEQMRSAKDVDARADVWALGVIVHELLGGSPPFDSDTLGGLMSLVLTEAPQPLRSTRPGLPPALYDAVSRCLEKDRNARWSSVAEFAAALAPFAPARALPLVERIAIVLGRTANTAVGLHGSASQSGSHPEIPIAGGLGVATSHGWGDSSQAAGSPRTGKKKWILAAVGSAGVLVLVAGAAFISLRHGASPAAPLAASASGPLIAVTGLAATAVASQPAAAATAAPESTPVASALAEPSPVASVASSAPHPARKGPASSGHATRLGNAPSARAGTTAPPLTPTKAPVPSQGGILDTSN